MASTLSMQETRTIGNFLLDTLYDNGVKHIFGVPGDYILEFDKQIELHAIQYVNATRENTAGYMADAYARLKGLGVACITYGVGIDIVNPLSVAFTENSPIVVISGTASLKEFALGENLHHLLNKQTITHQMDTTQFEILRHFTVDQAILTCPETAQAQIERVLFNCLKHKKPVYIEIPRGMANTALPSISNTAKPHTPVSSEKYTEKVIPLLDSIQSVLQLCQQPVIWAGHEILRDRLSSYLLKFAKKYNIPVVTTLLGKTAINEREPIYLGIYQGRMSLPEIQKYVESGDCLIRIGAVLSDVDTGIFTANMNQPHQMCISREKILIEKENYYGFDLTEILKGLADYDMRLSFDHFKPIPQEPTKFTPAPSTPITSKRLFECLKDNLREENIIAADFGDSLFGSSQFTLSENSFLASSYFGTLGFGIPAAVAAQIAEPHRRVIGIVGDGAFQMTATELSTAIRYDAAPIIIVLNNHGYGTERPLLEGSYNDILNWNYSLLPQFLGGGIGLKVTTEEEFFNSFITALADGKNFYLIEVDLDKMDFSPPLASFLSAAKK